MNATDDPRAHASLLVLEVGNSHVSVATAIDGCIRTHERFGLRQPDAVVECAEQAWHGLPDDRLKAVAAASVVPAVLDDLQPRLAARLGQPVRVVGRDIHRPLSLAVEAPDRVGIDRICSAAAAYDSVRRACVIASFGTAITIDFVNDEGAFMGGAILPGVEAQARALHESTAQLPAVKVTTPSGIYGASTEDAISTGVLFGIIGGLREIVERYATELGSWPELVGTGGNVEMIGPHAQIIDHIVPDLCVRGIALAYRKHFSPFEESK